MLRDVRWDPTPQRRRLLFDLSRAELLQRPVSLVFRRRNSGCSFALDLLDRFEARDLHLVERLRLLREDLSLLKFLRQLKDAKLELLRLQPKRLDPRIGVNVRTRALARLVQLSLKRGDLGVRGIQRITKRHVLRRDRS